MTKTLWHSHIKQLSWFLMKKDKYFSIRFVNVFPLDYVCVSGRSGGKKCSFFGKFGVHSCYFLLRFALWPSYRWFIKAFGNEQSERILDQSYLINICDGVHLHWRIGSKPIWGKQIHKFDWKNYLSSSKIEKVVSYGSVRDSWSPLNNMKLQFLAFYQSL